MKDVCGQILCFYNVLEQNYPAENHGPSAISSPSCGHAPPPGTLTLSPLPTLSSSSSANARPFQLPGREPSRFPRFPFLVPTQKRETDRETPETGRKRRKPPGFPFPDFTGKLLPDGKLNPGCEHFQLIRIWESHSC